MLINIEDNKLTVIDNDLTLEPRHKSQLEFWEFSRAEDRNCFQIEDDIPDTLKKIIDYFKKNSVNYELNSACKNLINCINERNDRFVKLKESAKQFKDGVYDKKRFKEYLLFLEENIPRALKEHQKKASYYHYLLGNAANFSVPGSGKTTVILSVYEKLRKEGKVNTLFVVGPTACFGPWKEEFLSTLRRELHYEILAGGNSSLRKFIYSSSIGESELYLTTFNTLLNDQDEVCSFLNDEDINAFVVVDEAHYIKKVDGSWATAALKISQYSEYRCVLTGTPIPKDYADLYNLFDFLWPNEQPIQPEDRVEIEILGEDEGGRERIKEIIDDRVNPLFYRVRKSELNLKKPVFIDPIKIAMHPVERKLYEAIITKIRDYPIENYLQDINLVLRLVRGRMMRLRQCFSYAKLLNTAIDDYIEDLTGDDSDIKSAIQNYDDLEIPAKLNSLLSLVGEFQSKGNKVIIWSNFIGAIKLIERNLMESGYRCKKIIGETPVKAEEAIKNAETREKIRNEFLNEESGLDILLANPAACAESMSLHTTCHHAVYYDLSHNCAQYLQSLDRIHRVGGSEKQESYYYFLQYEDTVEFGILDNLKEKERRMYELIEKDFSIYSLDITSDDDEELEIYKKLFPAK